MQGHPKIHHNRILQCVYIVAVWSTAQYNAAIDVFHWKPPETRSFNIPTAKFQEKQASSQQTTKEEPASHMPTGCIAKLQVAHALNNQIIIILNFPGETRTTVVNTMLENKIVMITILVQVLGIMDTSQEDQHSPTPGLKRYNHKYSPPIYPPRPSLNSSFPEALSKSLLQIAENQFRTIEAMKASQEAQAEAYKEMSRTNKMRDDDTLF